MEKQVFLITLTIMKVVMIITSIIIKTTVPGIVGDDENYPGDLGRA